MGDFISHVTLKSSKINNFKYFCKNIECLINDFQYFYILYFIVNWFF